MLRDDLKQALRGMSILIVDDQEANIALLEGFLEEDGYASVISTTDARQALPLYREVNPDLVLLDLHMPHLNGFEVLKQICADVPHDAYVPILVLTADINPEAKRRALQEGARDFLSKPLDFDEVSARIENLLETRYLHLQLHERNRNLEVAMREVQQERKVSEKLLLNVLPRPIADRLKQEGGIIADSIPEATVLFADIKQFTPIIAGLTPDEVLTWLSEVFTFMDRLTEEHGLEKIKTVGDSYMAASGVPTPREDHVSAAADLALAIRDASRERTAPRGEPLQLRIGLHTGPVVAGVLGTSKFAYDLWGDTVNIASRMESHGIDGCIQVTEEIYRRLSSEYAFQARGPLEIRGKGVLKTYLLLDRRETPAPA